MKKYLKYILLICFLFLIYELADRMLDKMYLNQYTINDYTDDTRFTTVNKVIDARYKKSKVAILVNTEYIDQIVSVAPFAYNEDIPVFYTEKNRVMRPVLEEMEKLGVEKVILIGGINSLTDVVERSLDRHGYKTERINEAKGINMSIRLAEMLSEKAKVDSVAVVTTNEFDLPNAVSFSPIAQSKHIPTIVIMNENKDFIKLKEFIDKHKIKNVYLIGNEGFLNGNITNFIPKEIRIEGKDRYDVNTKIISKFFGKSENGKVYISKGGEVMHKRHIASGQLINAMAITPLAADNNAPLFLVENNYFSTDDTNLINANGYKELNQVGFKIERRNYLNIERLKNFTTIALMFISLLIAFTIIRDKREVA